MGYKRNYNSLLPDDFVLSEEFETIIEQLENTKDHFYITGKAGSETMEKEALKIAEDLKEKYVRAEVSIETTKDNLNELASILEAETGHSLPRLFRQGTLRK